MRRNLALVVLVQLMVCGMSCDDSGGGGGSPEPILVDAQVYLDGSNITVIVSVKDDAGSFPVTGALVMANGQVLGYDVGNEDYRVSGVSLIAAGDPVLVTVEQGERAVSGSLTMPDPVSVTAPNTAGSPYNATVPIVVQWTALSPAPDKVSIAALSFLTVSGDFWESTVDGALTQTIIPADTLITTSTAFTLLAAAYNELTSLSGDAASGSGMTVANLSESEPITTQ